MRPQLTIHGNVEVLVRLAESGKLIRRHQVKNLWPLAGLNQVRDLLMYPSLGPQQNGFTPAYVAVGSSGAPTIESTTALGGEVFRKLITAREPLAAGSGFIVTMFLDAGEANGAGTQQLREVGIFTLSSGGAAWSRAVHTLINKTNQVTVTYRWTHFLTAV